jgi:transcriptional regulator with XRE-family HTH domain
MIQPNQIRAARNFLNLDQKTVAEASGVSTMNISDIENEKGNPRSATLQAIQSFFENRGIKFTENGGIEPAQNYVTVYEGKNCYLNFLSDAEETLSHLKGEILFSGSNERRSPPEVIDKLRSMRLKGITMKSLVENKDTYLMGLLSEYRWMPEGLFVDGDIKAVYADRVAYLVSWAENPRVIVIQDKTIAEEANRHFNFIWDMSEVPDETTSDILYEEDNGKN